MSLQLPQLHLLSYQPTLRTLKEGHEIFDPFRRKWVKLTPEEWVRQSFLNHLVEALGYPKGRIGVEFQVKYNALVRRTDAVVFNEIDRPLIIIECKAHTIEITEDVFFQACMYNRELQAKWLFLTNGITHIAADISGDTVKFFEEVPAFKGMKNEE